MEYYVDTTQRWKLSKIRKLADDDCFTILPHQRLEKNGNKRKGPTELISAIVNKELQTPWVYSDINSNYEYAKFRNDEDEIRFFKDQKNHIIKNDLLGIELNKVRIYSIEDSQQRTADLRLIKDSHFSSEEEKEIFWDSEVPVFINHYCSIMKLVKIFTRINDGGTLTTDEKLWGFPSLINNQIKEVVIKKDWINLLYTKKRKDESIRDLYKNLKRILLICGFYEKINQNIKTTEKTDVKLFTESEEFNIESYKNVLNCFEEAVHFLSFGKNKKRSKLVLQAKTTFILHILNSLGMERTDNIIDETLEIFTDTRKRPEYWYKEMLEHFQNK